MTFYFGRLLHHSSLTLIEEGHTTIFLFICYWRRMHSGWTLPIFEQSLGFYIIFGVLVVSHKEGVVLLFLQAFLALVVRLAHK